MRWAGPVYPKPLPRFPELYIKAAGRPHGDPGQVYQVPAFPSMQWGLGLVNSSQSNITNAADWGEVSPEPGGQSLCADDSSFTLS